LNLPGTDDTTGLMTAQRIAMLKEDAILMNVGRGTAIDQDALNEALRGGKIAGALLDVTNPEPLPADHPLWTAPNCLVTPHVSGNYSLQYTCEVLLDIFENNLKKFAKGEKLDNVADRKAGY
ncbi:MAG: D-2-hydroxyacid dehydrogenase, partial [Clostridia bacterium]|nr:D-2-hydroxyacid dehydrogenase [Clostridia bacterium]